ncbi:MAG: murein L,D-transpeptidase catalytic domain family protein [Betaproteobacteria bacterium]|nr:murein L,D-transpeptidase catalytic domain family protein [Betaproteobacteria bacterium]
MSDAHKRVMAASRPRPRRPGAWALALLCVALSARAGARAGAPAWERLAETIHAQAPNIGVKAILTSLDAYFHLEQRHLTDKPLVTIVDFALSSARRRLAVADVRTGKVLFYTYVAQGKGSGLTYATRFSNQAGSDASSLGVYLTGHSYYGNDGYSLRLHGLNPGFNSAAYRRDIVMHGAWYVSKAFARKYGRMGRSWGCFALSRTVESSVVNVIRDGTVLVGYYPDPKWLDSLRYLHGGRMADRTPRPDGSVARPSRAAVRVASTGAPERRFADSAGAPARRRSSPKS